MTNPAPKPPAAEDPLRPHAYDGIVEYDKRLPNWWLATLYVAIIFWIGYWFFYERAHLGLSSEAAVQQEMARIEAARLSSSTAQLDDESLWKMSRNAVIVDAGRAAFNSNCASCHTANLTGGIGPNLIDNVWLHGGRPTEVLAVVTNGAPLKGMPAWSPVIGPKNVSETVAYILSHHQQGEPVTVAPGN